MNFEAVGNPTAKEFDAPEDVVSVDVREFLISFARMPPSSRPLRKGTPSKGGCTVAVTLNGDLVSCPYCKRDVRLLRICKAAMLADVSRRTIYNYIDEGSVYAIKIAGKTLRVCPSCLLVEQSDAR